MKRTDAAAYAFAALLALSGVHPVHPDHVPERTVVVLLPQDVPFAQQVTMTSAVSPTIAFTIRLTATPT